jgi:L-ascorbate metabolism protein UlaG (beta-lactamase superfamily)
MKITKLGHCCLIIEIDGVRFLTDPGNYTTAQNEVENIDAIVISHEHTDHFHVESLKKVLLNNPKAQIITNESVGKILETEGLSYIRIGDAESIAINGVEIYGHGTKHAPIYHDYEQVENTGYMFGRRVFYPGDEMHVPRAVPVEILAFPVTAPWLTIADAVDYVLKVKPKVAFPVHDGNLVRHGLINRLPALKLPEAGIEFIPMDLGKEYEF